MGKVQKAEWSSREADGTSAAGGSVGWGRKQSLSKLGRSASELGTRAGTTMEMLSVVGGQV